MKIQVEDIDSCNKKLKLEIPFNDYNKKIQAAYNSLGREVKVPGFRKGKVPFKILEKRFGSDVKKEVLTQLISENLTQAIQEKELHAVGAPSLLEVHAEEGTDISVSASVQVVPEFAIQDYSGIEIDLKINRVTDKEVEDVIEVYRQRKAKSVPITDRPVQKDDLIKIDFNGLIDGKEFKDGQAKDFVLQVGAAHLIPKFDEQVTGMQLGEEKTFKLALPANHTNPDIAGKEVEFKVLLKGIQIKELPELNDEFAKTADAKKSFAGLEEMREDLRQRLEDYERVEAKKAGKLQLEEKLAEMHPIDVPEGLVQEQIRFMVNKEKKAAGQAAGSTHDHDHEHGHDHPDPITPEDEKKHRASAVKLLQQELVIGKLTEQLNMEVSEEELNKELMSLSAMMGAGNHAKLKEEWRKSGALTQLQGRLRRDKTLDAVMAKVTSREEMVDRETKISDN